MLTCADCSYKSCVDNFSLFCEFSELARGKFTNVAGMWR